MMRRLTLLGATGSIGASTLDVVARHPDRFAVVALAAHSNTDKLAVLCQRFRPAYAALADHEAASALQRTLASDGIEAHWLFGVPPAAIEVVIHPQSVIHSLVEYVDGSVLGVLPTLGSPRGRCRVQ